MNPGQLLQELIEKVVRIEQGVRELERREYASDGGGGGGDMYKSVYDTNYNNVVDAAEAAPWSGITGKPSTFPPEGHNHDASHINSGTLSTDRFSAYSDLVAESKIGAGGAQVAAGDHSHNGAGAGSYPCQGRLTLTSGTPVTTSDVSAATTIYFTPFNGNKIALYSGAAWVIYTLTERSIAVPATTDTNYDVFIYDNAGTLTLELTAWTNNTTRATALTTQDGVLVRSGATTRRYVGTVRTTGTSGQINDTGLQRFVINYYNRFRRHMRNVDNTAHTYNSSTFRAFNGDESNKIEFLYPFLQEPVDVTIFAGLYNDGGGTAQVRGGLDSFSAGSIMPAGGMGLINANIGQIRFTNGAVVNPAVIGIGYHFIGIQENRTGVGTLGTFLVGHVYAGVEG